MLLANYHTHTARCHHAAGEDREYIETAIRAGMKVLGFADHCPWIFPDGHVSHTRMTPAELDGYFTSLQDLRKEYEKDIAIYIGFEAEYIPELMEAQNKLLADYPVDYMILGEHFLEREPFGPYTGFPFADEEMFIRYVDLCIAGMETGKYKYLAHPDLFNFIGEPEIFGREYRRLCDYLKAHDIPVEINILGLQQKRHYTSERFLRIAQEAGCSAIIGVDAHTPAAMHDTAAIREAESLAAKYHLPLVDFLAGLE